jgi:hypothetical protein
MHMAAKRILVERSLPQDGDVRGTATRRRARSVTVNLAESPLGWLYARRMLSERQFFAGERLRVDYEAAQLGARVTMRWDEAPPGHGKRGAPDPAAATHAQISAKQRFEDAVSNAGDGLSDILWRVVCAGEKVPVAEKALNWPVRAGRLVLAMALDRVADFYRIGG